LGEYAIFGDQFAAPLIITKHNAAWLNVFGDDSQEFTMRAEAWVHGNLIQGFFERTDRPGIRLPFRLIPKARLPG
ncbi:MAG: hypothetical protein ACREFH_06295, partial [Stellaceae bacterium]